MEKMIQLYCEQGKFNCAECGATLEPKISPYARTNKKLLQTQCPNGHWTPGEIHFSLTWSERHDVGIYVNAKKVRRQLEDLLRKDDDALRLALLAV